MTKGRNLSHDGHERQYNYTKPNLRDKTSKKKQEKEGKHNMQENTEQIGSMHAVNKVAHREKTHGQER